MSAKMSKLHTAAKKSRLSGASLKRRSFSAATMRRMAAPLPGGRKASGYARKFVSKAGGGHGGNPHHDSKGRFS